MRATAWPSPAITPVVSRKTMPRLTGWGNAGVPRSPWSGCGPDRLARITGKASTKPTRASSATGVQRR
jgi:hypothetical protein